MLGITLYYAFRGGTWNCKDQIPEGILTHRPTFCRAQLQPDNVPVGISSTTSRTRRNSLQPWNPLQAIATIIIEQTVASLLLEKFANFNITYLMSRPSGTNLHLIFSTPTN